MSPEPVTRFTGFPNEKLKNENENGVLKMYLRMYVCNYYDLFSIEYFCKWETGMQNNDLNDWVNKDLYLILI